MKRMVDPFTLQLIEEWYHADDVVHTRITGEGLNRQAEMSA